MLEVIRRNVVDGPYAVRFVGEKEPCATDFPNYALAEDWMDRLEMILTWKKWSVPNG